MKHQSRRQWGWRPVLALGAVLVASATGPGFGQIINHTSVAGAATLPQATCNGIGAQRWLFTHASVGGDIMEGLDALHTANPTRYQLVTEWTDVKGTEGGSDYSAANAPASTTAGTVYTCARGNPVWQNKVLCFENSLKPIAAGGGGWGVGKVTAAVNKFCWIDPDAVAATYLASMATLEGAYPGVRLVYTTMPLTGLADAENDLRNEFNNAVRLFCTSNSKLLYDVADIEAWDPGGIQHTYVSGAHTYQLMYSGYADDPSGDWHPNLLGQQQLGLGWYATAAAVYATPPQPTAARLDSFRAVASRNAEVRLEWRTLMETDVLGFRVERRCPGSSWTAVPPGMIPAEGQAVPRRYALIDAMAGERASLEYRLLEIDLRGRERALATAHPAVGFELRAARDPAGLVIELFGEPDARWRIEAAESLDGPWMRLADPTLEDHPAERRIVEWHRDRPARFFRIVVP